MVDSLLHSTILLHRRSPNVALQQVCVFVSSTETVAVIVSFNRKKEREGNHGVHMYD